MKLPRPVTVDFETHGIAKRPAYPPVPVGVSIKEWGKKPVYYSWGHASDNNCTRDKAVAALTQVWHKPEGLLFHNANFDLDVAEVHFGLKPPPWGDVHDSMYLLFLDDPHQREIGLKPAATRLLGVATEERDAVADWLIQNQPIAGVKISSKPQSKEPFGKYIAHAPGSVVGPYANGDTARTEAIFKLLWPRIKERNMLPAYDRERQLAPILLDMERRGIRVDLPRLETDVGRYRAWRSLIDAWLRKRLKVGPEINLDSGAQLVAALVAAGIADTSRMGVTKTGRVSTNKDAMAAGVSDKLVASVLRYDTQLSTCLATFMEPWLEIAKISGGLIYTTWHATRGAGHGTRTGRLASTPNFQNIPNEFDPIFLHEADSIDDPVSRHIFIKECVKSPWPDLAPLPLCRDYIIPHKGQVLCGRDFASQELRILAHFEDGQMLEGYLTNPDIDFHQHAADLVTKITGVRITRKRAKTIGFSILYGSGLTKLAAQLGCSYNEAQKLLTAYFQVFPGIKIIQAAMRQRARDKLPIRTIGGREYYCEEPMYIDGRYREFHYKLINYLIQASAADQTKAAMIRFVENAGYGKLILTVHDEIVISTKAKKADMLALRNAMNYTTLDVPMRSDGECGLTWASMEKWDG